MKKKYIAEDVYKEASAVHSNKYSYLELIVGEGRTKLRALCDKHGEFIATIKNHIGQKHGCPKCGKEILAKCSESRKITLEQFKQRAAKVHGDRYTYTAITHSKGRAIVSAVCSIHGMFSHGVHQHLNGQGCRLCGIAKRGKAQQYKLDEVKLEADKVHGGKYTYNAISVKDGRTYIRYTCNAHGQHTQAVKAHLKGQGCPICARIFVGIKSRHLLEDYTKKAEKVHGDSKESGYTYLNLDYSKGKPVVTFICEKHGQRVQAADKHLAGQGCPQCNTKITKPCKEIFTYLEQLGCSPVVEHRFPGLVRFFDIAIHDKKLVIEFNGNYWHSSEYIPSGYHLSKTKIARDNGYRCIHIHSCEWADKRRAVEYMLSAAVGKISRKVYARNTSAETISKEEATGLLEEFHLQGVPATGDFVALRESGNIVAIMVFNSNTSNRAQKSSEDCVELTRYATSKSVVGGFTKLLNYYLKLNPKVRTVVSYSDDRLYTGGVYEKAGFKKLYTTQPDYRYLEGEKLYHKAGYQKSKLIKRFGADFCEGKTERQITEEQGIYRVYDCGKTKWLLTV